MCVRWGGVGRVGLGGGVCGWGVWVGCVGGVVQPIMWSLLTQVELSHIKILKFGLIAEDISLNPPS